MGRLRKKYNTNIGRQNKYYKREKDVILNEENKNKVDGDDVYNKIRAMREQEASELKDLNQNTINNVQTYINDMNNTIEEVREFKEYIVAKQEDDNYEYLGAVYSLNELTKLSVINILKKGKVPYVWVVDRNLFMYYVNGIWSDDKTVKDWVVVYKDEDLALKSFEGEVRMLLFKDIEDINMDNRKIANILSIVSGLNVDLVENIIECVEDGWEPEAIYNLNDGEISNELELEDVERIAEDYNYWINLGFNRVQVDYKLEVEDDDADIELVELVTDNQQELDVENVAQALQTMDMAEIYNEIVQERSKQEEEIEVPFNGEDDDFDELFLDDDEMIYEDDELDFEDDEMELDFEDDEMELDEDDELDFEDDDIMEIFDELENEELVQENVEPQVNMSVATDLYASGYLIVTTREGSDIPAIFGKVDNLNLDGATQDTLDIAELVMDDTLGSDNVVFEDQDLLAILKIRISALLDMKNEDGVQLFKDDKCLNNVLDKLTEAQMWLDLWTKLN